MKHGKTNFCVRQMVAGSNCHQIYLYDDISKYGEFNWETWDYDESETSAEHFRKLMEEIPAEDEIELFINSNGGDVDQGTAIYNILKRHPGKITGYVDGVCHSIAFTIFQACDKRVMGEGTSAIIHDMWMCVSGNANDLRKAADDLDVMMDSCIELFMQRAKNVTAEELRQMMHDETVLTPQKALEIGLCDEVGTIPEAACGPAEDPDDDDKDEKDKLLNKVENLTKELANVKSHQENLKEFMQSAMTPKHEEPQVEKQEGIGFNAFFQSER